MTFKKIRAELPTHIMLTPGVHRWRGGDEFKKSSNTVWRSISEYTGKGWATWDNKVIEVEDGTNVRRPIPTHILDNQAWWICYESGGLSIIEWSSQHHKGRLYDKWFLEQME